LIHYLSDRLAIPDLHYLQEPARVSDGWETSIYHFELGAAEALPAEFQGLLTLRLFACARGIPQGRHDYAAQCFVQRLGYPVPRPVLWEERCDILGGPLLIMERIPGPTLVEWSLAYPWTVVRMGRQLAQMQTRLHKLPADGFPCPAEPLLDRSLREMEDTIGEYALPSLTPALNWLRGNRPDNPAFPRILHLDFHPRNLIHRGGQPPAVLDWDTADVGDPHADIGTSVVFLHCAPNIARNRWQRFLMAVGQVILEKVYLFACRRRMELDQRKLAYYQAWAVLRRLCRCCRCLIDGPRAMGIKPSWVQHVDHEHLAQLCAHFRRITGVAVTLDEKAWTVHPR
jgi:hypothetical protein